MNTIDKQKMDLYIQEGQKVGLSGKDVINGFVKRGFEVEGIDNNAVKIELGLIEPEDNSFNPIKRTGQMLGDIPQDIQKTGQNIASTFQRGQERIGNIQERTISGEQSLASGAFQTIGQGLSTGAGIIGDLFIGGASLFTTPQEEQAVQDKLIQGVQALGKTDVGQGVAELADQYNAFKQSNPEIAGNLEASLGFAEAVLEVTGAGAGLKAAKQAGRRGTQAVANATGEALESTAGVLKSVPSVSGISKPKKGVEQLVKEITQEGDPRKLKQNIEALTSIADDIDPQKGLTVQGLRSQVKDKQKAIIQAVDDELLKDTKLYSIDELTDSFEGRSGVINTNPVKDTFEELETIYTQAKDLKGLDELNFLRNKAETVGLSKKEVNDLARIYNRDAAKGFSKSGEPLTSVGAQASENTRKSLKNVARSGLSDNAKELDSVYGKTVQLDKSLNAFEKGVNNLQKKAGDRGIIEKLSNQGAKIFNLVTANGARGFFSGLLQSNVGSKTRNFLALEEALADNIKLLQKAGSPKAKTSTVINAIESIAEKLKNVNLPDVETKPFLGIDTPIKDLGKRIKDTPNKQGGFVKNPLASDGLVSQAKKFDTVEEFVGSQNGWFHGTPFEGDIRKIKTGKGDAYFGKGVYLSGDKKVASEFVNNLSRTGNLEEVSSGVFQDINTGKIIKQGKGKIIKIYPSEKLNLKQMTEPEYSKLMEEFRKKDGSINLEAARESINKSFVSEGYDGLNVLPTKNFNERQVLIFNESVDKLKTKHELEEIFNQAKNTN